MSTADHLTIVTLLDAIRSRLWLRRAAGALFAGLMCAALLALLAGLVHRLHGALALPLVIAVVGLPGLAALARAAFWPRPARAVAARAADRALAGRDVLVAALDQLQRPVAQRAGAASVVLAQAARRIHNVRAAQIVDWHGAWSGPRPLLVLAPALAAAVLLAGPGAGPDVPLSVATLARPVAAAAHSPAGALAAALARVQAGLAPAQPGRPERDRALAQHANGRLSDMPADEMSKRIARQEQPGAVSSATKPASAAAPNADEPVGADAGNARAATPLTDHALAELAGRRELSVRRDAGTSAAGAGPARDGAGPVNGQSESIAVAVAPAPPPAPLTASSALSPALRGYADRYFATLERAP